MGKKGAGMIWRGDLASFFTQLLCASHGADAREQGRKGVVCVWSVSVNIFSRNGAEAQR